MNAKGKYQFWLCDDKGNRLAILDDFSYFSYSRSNHGYGTLEIGLPYRIIVRPRLFFAPDWRIDVWRQPSEEFPFRRECSFLLRKFRVYRRAQDGMLMIIYYGRSPIDILRRYGGFDLDTTALPLENGSTEIYTYSWNTTTTPGNISSAMLQIASLQLTNNSFSLSQYYPGFSVLDENFKARVEAPTLTNYYTFGRNALEMISELRDASVAMNFVDPTQKKVYFDVIEVQEPMTGVAPRFSYEFRTYVGLRGADRTENGVVFSTQNGNLSDPVMSEDWLDEYNTIIMWNKASGISFAVQNPSAYTASIFNKNYLFQSTSANTIAGARAEGRAILKKNAKVRAISATFLDTPGGPQQPRSLYGVDWDFGDLVNVRFAGFSFQCEVMIVYVSVDEDGRESVTGRNEVGA